MKELTKTEREAHRYFNFNVRVPDSGNVPRDKALLKIEFERAIDEFFESKPAIIQFSNDDIDE